MSSKRAGKTSISMNLSISDIFSTAPQPPCGGRGYRWRSEFSNEVVFLVRVSERGNDVPVRSELRNSIYEGFHLKCP